MNVLVTGGAGFVGRAFVKHFRSEGHKVVEIDIKHSNAGWREDCRDWFGTWTNPGLIDLVIHCAAVVGGRATIDGEPLRLMAEDLSIDAALFRWALRARPGRIVYFSSSAAYPVWAQHEECGGAAMSEDFIGAEATQQPDATYGWVKLTGERLAAEANAAGIKTHVFRPFSGYGSDQALDYPFPTFIRRALERNDRFDIWGRGDSARDWIHIDDIVAAVLAAIDQDVLGPVNLCTGEATTFDELAALCMAAAGHIVPARYIDDAPQGVHWRVGDPARMLEFYRPKIELGEGIIRAMRGLR